MGWRLVDEDGVLRHRRVRSWPWWLPLATLGVLLFLAVVGFRGIKRLEETNTFCASCHTQPEVTFVERYAAGEAVDLATVHYTDEAIGCIGCHAGRGDLGRLAAMRSGASHLWVFLTLRDPEPGVMREKYPDAFCLKCHDAVLEDQAFANHYHYMLPQWQENFADTAACSDCHTGHAALSTDAVSAGAEANFMDANRINPVCEACHEDTRSLREGS